MQITCWEYRMSNLNDLPRKGTELELLNTAGAEGWELILIAVNRVAYFKRRIEDDPLPRRRRGATEGK